MKSWRSDDVVCQHGGGNVTVLVEWIHLHPTPSHVDDNIWTLYGLFQLSNHLVCSDGESLSPNICGMSCKLIDDDINDDINCVFTIFQYLL
uniref:Uncharacterized protein n=1 Tax=Sparus aurata TaxID=8175 RepID=A0A671TJC9_SPAAU